MQTVILKFHFHHIIFVDATKLNFRSCYNKQRESICIWYLEQFLKEMNYVALLVFGMHVIEIKTLTVL